ncbi:hypothetical protein [Streptomyces sp. CB01580]|uniref:hypothetical protein n=1 Tax=Streptomyces sp. CB01580 TaxID=1703933 RepID=UPI000B23F0EA|nr:hypothetical protein [Streptomyces sp. CB01580]
MRFGRDLVPFADLHITESDAPGRLITGTVRAAHHEGWQTAIVIREPAELQIDDDGRVSLPLGLLAEAGLDAGGRILAFSDGDGRIVLQREVDAFKALLQDGTL